MFGQGKQDAAATSIPQMNATGTIRAGEFFAIRAEGEAGDPIRVLGDLVAQLAIGGAVVFDDFAGTTYLAELLIGA